MDGHQIAEWSTRMDDHQMREVDLNDHPSVDLHDLDRFDLDRYRSRSTSRDQIAIDLIAIHLDRYRSRSTSRDPDRYRSGSLSIWIDLP